MRPPLVFLAMLLTWPAAAADTQTASLTIRNRAFDPAELRRQRLITPLARDEKLLLTIEELERIKCERYAD